MCCPIGDLTWLLSTGNMANVTEELDFKYLVVIHLHLDLSTSMWPVALDRAAPEPPSSVPHMKYSTAVGVNFRGETKNETHTSSTDSYMSQAV